MIWIGLIILGIGVGIGALVCACDGDMGLAFLTSFVLIIGMIFTVAGIDEISQQKRLISMPQRIAEMRLNVRTEQEKEIVNKYIEEYNQGIESAHASLLPSANKLNKREQKVFALEPIELIP